MSNERQNQQKRNTAEPVGQVPEKSRLRKILEALIPALKQPANAPGVSRLIAFQIMGLLLTVGITAETFFALWNRQQQPEAARVANYIPLESFVFAVFSLIFYVLVRKNRVMAGTVLFLVMFIPAIFAAPFITDIAYETMAALVPVAAACVLLLLPSQYGYTIWWVFLAGIVFEFFFVPYEGSHKVLYLVQMAIVQFILIVLMYSFATGSERKSQALESALKREAEARAAADEANRAKSRFLANMSHELRTPLNAIIGFAQLMNRDRTLNTHTQENVEIILRSGDHLLTLINDVLEMSKIEAGRTALHETSFDLFLLLQGMEEMFRIRAEKKSLQLLFERTDRVPQHVCGDEAKLRQILLNLLGNAIKFSEKGGIAVRVDAQRDGERYRLLFEVEDTGTGIAPEEQSRVFEPFVQAVSSARSQEGTGLGLPISRQFVQLMHGNLSVKSEVGKGSLFKFDLLVGESTSITRVEPIRRVTGIVPGQPVYRMLVVEDKSENRLLLVQMLKPFGFEIREASDGQEGLALWQSWEPHLIWMDMRMPVMDGMEATRRIRATDKGKTVKIIALTASAFDNERHAILEAGCDDLITKPFRENSLFEKIAAHLGVQFTYEAETTPALSATTDASASVSLAGLPDDWIANLREAATRANAKRTNEVIDQIRADRPSLADALTGLVRDFRFDKIIALTQ